MTSKITAFAVMLSFVCAFASCVKSDRDDVTYYSDAAITSVTLGTVTCVRGTTSYTYSAAAYSMVIDETNALIYNADSLSVGTVASTIPVTITTKNDGIVSLLNPIDGSYTTFSAGSYVDFSTPRTFRVTSSDGTNFRDYVVSVSVHQEYADSYTWSTTPGYCPAATGFTSLKACVNNGVMYLLGVNASSNYEMLGSADGTAWNSVTMPGASPATDATFASCNGKMFVLNAGLLYASTDAVAWAHVAVSGAALKSLMGGCNDELYAIDMTDAIVVSTDGGATWKKDNMESKEYIDNTDKLPATDISLVSAPSRTNTEVSAATIIANCADATYSNAVVWNKIVDVNDRSQCWMFTNTQWNNKNNVLLRMAKLSATYYGDGIVVVGGDNPQTIYYSPDHGTTWHQQSGLTLPAGFSAANGAALVADGKGFVYLIATGSGQVWKGRLNRLTWINPNAK